MAVTMVRHRFSVDDYEQMIEFGVLTENDRVELIRGEIIDKMSIGDRHAATVKRLRYLLGDLVAKRATIGVQDPVRLDDSEPEPDISLLQPRSDYYASGHPRAADVLLLIEVSDTSIDLDRDVKGPLYAQSHIVEYWILNLNDDTLEVYRQPQSAGTYSDARILRRGDQIEIASLPGVIVQVAELL